MDRPANILDQITQEDYENISDPDWPDYQTLKSRDRIPQNISSCIEQMLDKTRKQQQQVRSFCALAFFGREYRLTPSPDGRYDNLRCCGKSPNNIAEIHRSMIMGEKHRSCENTCWSMENVNITSLRQIKNSTIDFVLDRSVESLYQDILVSESYPAYIYKIESSNICDGLCVTCGSLFSTAWQNLEKQNNEVTAPFIRMIADAQGLKFEERCNVDISLPIDYKNAKVINFFGGESTLEKTNYRILEQLLQHDNDQCIISFTTHGNFDLTDSQKKLISRFPRFQFNFSIDAIGKQFEYLRYPFKWNKLLTNIEWCRQQNIDISAVWTLSNLNIFYFDEIQSWFEQNDINYRINRATSHKNQKGTKEFYISSLSRRIKDEIIKRNHSITVRSLLTAHDESDTENYGLFLKDLVRQDQWKKISIHDYLGEFADLISEDLQKIRKTIPVVPRHDPDLSG